MSLNATKTKKTTRAIVALNKIEKWERLIYFYIFIFFSHQGIRVKCM